MTHRFDARADEFIAMVNSCGIAPATEVMLLLHCTDLSGNPLDPIRMDVAPLTTVKMPSDPGFAREFAMQQHMDAIIGNIISLVRTIPDTPFQHPDGPPVPVIVRDVSLDIVHPQSTSDDQ